MTMVVVAMSSLVLQSTIYGFTEMTLLLSHYYRSLSLVFKYLLIQSFSPGKLLLFKYQKFDTNKTEKLKRKHRNQ